MTSEIIDSAFYLFGYCGFNNDRRGGNKMKMGALSHWFAGLLLFSALVVWASLSIAGGAGMGKAGNATATDPRLDMVTALQAMGPHPSLGDQAKVFGRLVGTWDVEYTDFSKNGKVTHRSGEFLVGWVMEGRAIQDFLDCQSLGGTEGAGDLHGPALFRPQVWNMARDIY
jgi:hypothetical protein